MDSVGAGLLFRSGSALIAAACRGLTRVTYACFRPDNIVADWFECLHDVRVVRAFEKPERQTVVHRRTGELGHCAVRIPVAGASQSDWLHRDESWPAENSARSDEMDLNNIEGLDDYTKMLVTQLRNKGKMTNLGARENTQNNSEQILEEYKEKIRGQLNNYRNFWTSENLNMVTILDLIYYNFFQYGIYGYNYTILTISWGTLV